MPPFAFMHHPRRRRGRRCLHNNIRGFQDCVRGTGATHSPLPLPRGFVIVDAVAGLLLVSMLIMALAVLEHHYQVGMMRMENARRLNYAAEAAFNEMLSGHTASTQPVHNDNDRDITLNIQPTADAPLVNGYVWVRIEASTPADRRSQVLFGQIRQSQADRFKSGNTHDSK